MEPKMNTAMKTLIATLTAGGYPVEFVRDNCIIFKVFKDGAESGGDDKLKSFAIITPYHSVGKTLYFLVHRNEGTLTRMSLDKVVDTVREMQKED